MIDFNWLPQIMPYNQLLTFLMARQKTCPQTETKQPNSHFHSEKSIEILPGTKKGRAKKTCQVSNFDLNQI